MTWPSDRLVSIAPRSAPPHTDDAADWARSAERCPPGSTFHDTVPSMSVGVIRTSVRTDPRRFDTRTWR